MENYVLFWWWYHYCPTIQAIVFPKTNQLRCTCVMPLYIASSWRTTKPALQTNSVSAPQNIVSSATQCTQRHPQRPHVVDDTAKVTFTSIRTWCWRHWNPDSRTSLQILLHYHECPHVVAKITNKKHQGYADGIVICKKKESLEKVRGVGATGIYLIRNP